MEAEEGVNKPEAGAQVQYKPHELSSGRGTGVHPRILSSTLPHILSSLKPIPRRRSNTSTSSADSGMQESAFHSTHTVQSAAHHGHMQARPHHSLQAPVNNSPSTSQRTSEAGPPRHADLVAHPRKVQPLALSRVLPSASTGPALHHSDGFRLQRPPRYPAAIPAHLVATSAGQLAPTRLLFTSPLNHSTPSALQHSIPSTTQAPAYIDAGQLHPAGRQIHMALLQEELSLHSSQPLPPSTAGLQQPSFTQPDQSSKHITATQGWLTQHGPAQQINDVLYIQGPLGAVQSESDVGLLQEVSLSEIPVTARQLLPSFSQVEPMEPLPAAHAITFSVPPSSHQHASAAHNGMPPHPAPAAVQPATASLTLTNTRQPVEAAAVAAAAPSAIAHSVLHGRESSTLDTLPVAERRHASRDQGVKALHQPLVLPHAVQQAALKQAEVAHQKQGAQGGVNARWPDAGNQAQEEEGEEEAYPGQTALLHLLHSKFNMTSRRRLQRRVLQAWRQLAYQAVIDQLLLDSVSQLHAQRRLTRVFHTWHAIAKQASCTSDSTDADEDEVQLGLTRPPAGPSYLPAAGKAIKTDAQPGTAAVTAYVCLNPASINNPDDYLHKQQAHAIGKAQQGGGGRAQSKVVPPLDMAMQTSKTHFDDLHSLLKGMEDLLTGSAVLHCTQPALQERSQHDMSSQHSTRSTQRSMASQSLHRQLSQLHDPRAGVDGEPRLAEVGQQQDQGQVVFDVQAGADMAGAGTLQTHVAAMLQSGNQDGREVLVQHAEANPSAGSSSGQTSCSQPQQQEQRDAKQSNQAAAIDTAQPAHKPVGRGRHQGVGGGRPAPVVASGLYSIWEEEPQEPQVTAAEEPAEPHDGDSSAAGIRDQLHIIKQRMLQLEQQLSSLSGAAPLPPAATSAPAVHEHAPPALPAPAASSKRQQPKAHSRAKPVGVKHGMSKTLRLSGGGGGEGGRGRRPTVHQGQADEAEALLQQELLQLEVALQGIKSQQQALAQR